MESNGDLPVPIRTDTAMNVDSDSQPNPATISLTEHQGSKLQTEKTTVIAATLGAPKRNGENAKTDAAVSMENIVEKQMQNSNVAPLGTMTAPPEKRIEDGIPSGFGDHVETYVTCPTANLDTESTDQKKNLNANSKNAPPRQCMSETIEHGVPLSNNSHKIIKSIPMSSSSSNFFFCDETDGPSTAIIGDRTSSSQSPLADSDNSRRLTNQLSDLSGYNAAPIAETISTADTTASLENQKDASQVDSTFREAGKRADSSRGGSSKDEHPNDSLSTNSTANHINEGRKITSATVSSGMDGKYRDPMELRQAQAPQQFAFQQYPSVGQMHPIQHIMYPAGAYDHMGAVQPQIPTQYHATHGMNPAMMQQNITTNNPPGRRSIHLHLMQEESVSSCTPRTATLNKLTRPSFLFRRDPNHSRAMSLTRVPSTNRLLPKSSSAGSLTALEKDKFIDKGSITVSWYDGTSASELQGHVKRSVIRKLRLEKGLRVEHIRIIDERVVPSEEIVLSPHIPDGSDFLLNFTIRDTREEDDEKATSYYQQQYAKQTKAPDSPSAAPIRKSSLAKGDHHRNGSGGDVVSKLETNNANGGRASEIKAIDTAATDSSAGYDETDDDLSIDPDDPVEERLRSLHDLLFLQKLNVKVSNKRKKVGEWKTKGIERHEREEKRQVVFVIANYFVLFLSCIAISAEIQSRAPHWMEWVEHHVETVQNCGHDRDALLQCVERGDIAGLIASLILFLSRSVAAKQFFLFGFDSPQKLWTVVYESFVTAICWGTSYIFIRRGLNPDTRPEFLQRYWKDAVYGSLAGFNAAFMKAILKNLIPQQVVEEALMDRRVKIVDWLLSLG